MRGKKTLQIISILLFYLLLAGLVMIVIYRNGYYPAGSDTMFHVYRGDVVYQSVKTGNWFPLLDPNWYNGAEIMRYWPPFPAYFQALCQFFAGGDLFAGYLWFCAAVFFLGAVAWLAIGIARNRMLLGAFLGVLWFFMPNNLFVLFWDGDLARSLSMIFLPPFVHYLHTYLHTKKKEALFQMMFCFFLLVLCQPKYALMVFLTALIYCVCHLFLYKDVKGILHTVIGMACAFLWTGVWSVAAFSNGVTASGDLECRKDFFQKAVVLLNPFYRSEMGAESLYFGLTVFVLAVLGVLLSKRKSVPGFVTGILVFFATTTAAYPMICRFPGSQHMWMVRFISIALTFILFSFLVWDTLRKPLVVLVCVCLVLDVIPSMTFVYGNKSVIPVEERYDEFAERTLMKEVKKRTTQRLAFMEQSATGATGAYIASSYGSVTPTSFGAGLDGANTAKNLVQLNEALEQGYYYYLFDRCLELGNDTILIDMPLLRNAENDLEMLKTAAQSVGYRCILENDRYQIYHLETYPSFGIVTKYDAIAIGTENESFAMLYPAMELGHSTNLNDYSYEELVQYKLIYLSGFNYTNKGKAENLIRRLSQDGVKIVISADGIPSDDKTGLQEFLGVNGYAVQFSNGYPMIVTETGNLDLDLFRGDHADWKTVYLEGLDDCWAYIEDKGEELPFYGTAENENIVFVGLNLVYHCTLTQDAVAIHLLSKAMEPITAQNVPERTLVPVEITYSGNHIRIDTEYNNVNTCIAYHDNFEVRDGREVRKNNNLTYVDAGVTAIDLSFPYFWQGMAVTMVGVVLAAVLLVLANRKE